MNPNDDDRSARSQVTLRLDRDLLARIDELARDEGVDRTELTRRLLADGLAHRRIESAIADYTAGRRSAWSAAQRAGVDLYEMLDRIAEAGVPYRIESEALQRLQMGGGSPGPGSSGGSPARALRRPATGHVADDPIALLRARYRPDAVRLLFVGESAPAGGTHFYHANSNLYRATREAFGLGLSLANPPEGEAFLAWFKELGCWLVDLADHPVNRAPVRERTEAVDGGVAQLTQVLRELQPTRVLVVLRRIAPAVRRAAQDAGVDDRAIDVLPFPARQWRPVYAKQLAGIVSEAFASAELGDTSSRWPVAPSGGRAIAETTTKYETPRLHDVMVDVLGRHGGWLRANEIAREIAADDLWHRPSDGQHPPASQISARARQYPGLFQTSDLGIRLRRR